MAANSITSPCTDTSEAIVLNAEMSLYLKPVAKAHISVQLPQLKSGGKAISNWEVMEKLKSIAKPEKFIVLKVIKSALEFIRLEGETESKAALPKLLAKLDGSSMKLSGYPEVLKIRAMEAKSSFPSRHDWDSYFRDAKNMNELNSGERPDTVHITDLPCKWFFDKHSSSAASGKPSEKVIADVFYQFGEIRCMDIPLLDPYREELSCPAVGHSAAGIQTFKFGQDHQFDVFIQFKEYMSFVKCMEAFKGTKLMHITKEGKAYTANIKVDFDKTAHLSEKSIKRREQERQKILALLFEKEKKKLAEKEQEERKQKDAERKAKEEEEAKLQRKKEREQRRMEKLIEMKRIEEEKKLAEQMAREERKMLVAQRRLESVRLLTELFELIKKQKTEEEVQRRERELVEEQKRLAEERLRQEQEAKRRRLEEKEKTRLENERKEKELREKIVKHMKEKEERQQTEQREALRRKIAGQARLKSAVILNKYIKESSELS